MTFDRRWLDGTVVLCLQGAALAAARLPTRNMLPNPDGVAYMRLASYYATGQYHLAVNGYFGPLFIWLMVPCLLVGMTPVVAARVATGVSIVVFIAGCAALFRTFDLGADGFVLATLLAAAAAAAWAFRDMSPDLLLGGLICLAIARMMSPRWRTSVSTQVSAGILWGVAYLAKSVALPMGVGVAVAVMAWLILGRLSTVKGATRAAATTTLCMLLVASPWIAVISWKYRALTFSTSARISHAIVGPSDGDRYHPVVRRFHVPEPGRVTAWEDPSRMPYRYWSPFDDRAHALYQLKLIYWNASNVPTRLHQFDRFGIGIAALILGLVAARPWRREVGQNAWRWTPVLVSILVLPFLPVFSDAERYYRAVYPLLIVAAVGLLTSVTGREAAGWNWRRHVGLAAIFLSFVQDPVAWRVASGAEAPAAYGEAVARKLDMAGIRGPVAGAGKDPAWPGGEHAHFYVAYHLNVPDYGAELVPTADRCVESGAALLVVPRNTKVAVDLAHDSRFRDLDPLLFGPGDAPRPPLKVYEVRKK